MERESKPVNGKFILKILHTVPRSYRLFEIGDYVFVNNKMVCKKKTFLTAFFSYRKQADSKNTEHPFALYWVGTTRPALMLAVPNKH